MDTRVLRLLDKLNMNRRKAIVFGQAEDEIACGSAENLDVCLTDSVLYLTARDREQCIDLQGMLELAPDVERLSINNIDKVIVSNSYVVQFKNVSHGHGEVEIHGGGEVVEAAMAYSEDTREQLLYIWDNQFSKNGEWHTREIKLEHDEIIPLRSADGSWLAWVEKEYYDKVAEDSDAAVYIHFCIRHGELVYFKY